MVPEQGVEFQPAVDEGLTYAEGGRMTLFDWGSGGQEAPPSGPRYQGTTEPRGSANWGQQSSREIFTGKGGTRGKGGVTDASRSELDLGMSGGQEAPPTGAKPPTTGGTRSGANWGRGPDDPLYTGKGGTRGKGGVTDASRSEMPTSMEDWRDAVSKFKGSRQTTNKLRPLGLDDFIEERAPLLPQTGTSMELHQTIDLGESGGIMSAEAAREPMIVPNVEGWSAETAYAGYPHKILWKVLTQEKTLPEVVADAFKENVLGGWKQAAQEVIEMNKELLQEYIPSATTVKDAYNAAFDPATQKIVSGGTPEVQQAISEARTIRDEIKAAGGAKAYFAAKDDGGAALAEFQRVQQIELSETERVAGMSTAPDVPQMPDAPPVSKTLAEMDAEWKELVKDAHDDPAFDGFDWSPTDIADAELELEDAEEVLEQMAFDLEMQDVVGDVQAAGETREAFMARVTGRPAPEGVKAPWVAKIEKALTPDEFHGVNSPQAHRNMMDHDPDMSMGEYVEYRRIEFPSDAVVEDQPALEMAVIRDFAEEAVQDQYLEMAKIVDDDLALNAEFGAELPSQHELLTMDERLDSKFFNKWVVARESQYYSEGIYGEGVEMQTIGLGKPQLFKNVAKSADRAFTRMNAHGITASRPVITPGDNMFTGGNPRALTQTLVADIQMEELGVTDFAALQQVVGPKVPVLQEMQIGDLEPAQLTPFDGIMAKTTPEGVEMELRVIPLPSFDLEEKMEMLPEDAELMEAREISEWSSEFEELTAWVEGGMVEEAVEEGFMNRVVSSAAGQAATESAGMLIGMGVEALQMADTMEGIWKKNVLEPWEAENEYNYRYIEQKEGYINMYKALGYIQIKAPHVNLVWWPAYVKQQGLTKYVMAWEDIHETEHIIQLDHAQVLMIRDADGNAIKKSDTPPPGFTHRWGPLSHKNMKPLGFVPDFAMGPFIHNQFTYQTRVWVYDDGRIGRWWRKGHGEVGTWNIGVLTGAAPYLFRQCIVMTAEGRKRGWPEYYRGEDLWLLLKPTDVTWGEDSPYDPKPGQLMFWLAVRPDTILLSDSKEVRAACLAHNLSNVYFRNRSGPFHKQGEDPSDTIPDPGDTAGPPPAPPGPPPPPAATDPGYDFGKTEQDKCEDQPAHYWDPWLEECVAQGITDTAEEEVTAPQKPAKYVPGPDDIDPSTLEPGDWYHSWHHDGVVQLKRYEIDVMTRFKWYTEGTITLYSEDRANAPESYAHPPYDKSDYVQRAALAEKGWGTFERMPDHWDWYKSPPEFAEFNAQYVWDKDTMRYMPWKFDGKEYTLTDNGKKLNVDDIYYITVYKPTVFTPLEEPKPDLSPFSTIIPTYFGSRRRLGADTLVFTDKASSQNWDWQRLLDWFTVLFKTYFGIGVGSKDRSAIPGFEFGMDTVAARGRRNYPNDPKKRPWKVFIDQREEPTGNPTNPEDFGWTGVEGGGIRMIRLVLKRDGWPWRELEQGDPVFNLLYPFLLEKGDHGRHAKELTQDELNSREGVLEQIEAWLVAYHQRQVREGHGTLQALLAADENYQAFVAELEAIRIEDTRRNPKGAAAPPEQPPDFEQAASEKPKPRVKPDDLPTGDRQFDQTFNPVPRRDYVHAERRGQLPFFPIGVWVQFRIDSKAERLLSERKGYKRTLFGVIESRNMSTSRKVTYYVFCPVLNRRYSVKVGMIAPATSIDEVSFLSRNSNLTRSTRF